MSALISSSKIKPLRLERDCFAVAIGGQRLPVLPVHLIERANFVRRLSKLLPRGFPNLPQRTVGPVDRIVIGDWQSCDGAIGFWPFARQPTKQIPLAPIRV